MNIISDENLELLGDLLLDHSLYNLGFSFIMKGKFIS